MSDGENDKLNRLERLKAKLFSKSYQTKIEYRDQFSSHPIEGVHKSWEESKAEAKEGKFERFMKQSSVFKKFFIFSMCIFGFAILYVGYMFFLGGNSVSNDNIEISIFGNTFTDGGEPLPLQIEVVNKNSSALELVDLVVEYPKGAEGDLSQDTERLRASLGSIEPGGIANESMTVFLFGQQGSIRPVRVSLEYRVEGTNSIFVKEKLYEVSINSTPINISLNAPTEVTPGQDVVLTVKNILNTQREIKDLLLRLDYPFGFEFISSEPAPSLGDNVWSLENLKPGQESEIRILGKMTDVFEGEEKTFHISTGLESRNDKSLIDVVYNSLAHTIFIERPFINLDLQVNGKSSDGDYAIPPKNPISGQIYWRNNLDIPISDLVISARFFGNALNRRSINTSDGFYNSSEDMIIWDRNSDPRELSLVEPGTQGGVIFNVAPNSLVTSSGELLFEPTIFVEVSVTGKQLLEGNIIKELKNSETKTIKVTSEASFVSKGLYFSGPFENTGPVPPEVEKETTYTIVWALSNSANNLTKAEVRSTLPTWMRFLGNVSPPSEDLTYNSASREILWRPGNISRGTGILTPPREVAFQLSFLPSLSQVETSPIILNDSQFSAQDLFSGAVLQITKQEITTELSNDPEFNEDTQGIVVD